MKKVFMGIFIAASVVSVASAYNPPAGGESIFEFSSPNSITGKQSVAGGALFSAGADSLIVNPALSAGEQRVNLNAGYTFLFSTNELNTNKIGSAFQTGILIPMKMFVFSGYMNGTFLPFAEMDLGSSMNFKASFAKEITDKLDVGLGINGGFAWGPGGDWALSGNIGVNYNFGDLGFFKDFRLGTSILNLGKNYGNIQRHGVYTDRGISPFPGFGTIKVGVGTTLLKNDFIKIGAALDVSTSFFQNLMIDFNAQFAIKDMFVISLGEKINMIESIQNRWSGIPSVGVSFKFCLDVKNNKYLENNGWNQSEMTISTGYRNLYSSVNGLSAGIDIDLGTEDTTPPVIKFLDEDDE